MGEIMLVKQIAVFLENKKGRLNSLVGSISNAGINMKALNIADTSDFGIVRLVTDDNEKALQIIKDAGFTASIVDLVGIEVEDKIGSLSSVLDALSQNEVSIEYMYSFTYKVSKTLILFKTDDIETAQKVLNKHKI